MLEANLIVRATITSKWFRIRLVREQLDLKSNPPEALKISEEQMQLWDKGQQIMMMLLQTVQARTSNLIFKRLITIIPTRMRCSINYWIVKETIRQIYKSLKSRCKVKNKELLLSNEKLSKREIQNMKKPKDNSQFPSREQDQLQSRGKAAIQGTLKSQTEMPRSPNLLNMLMTMIKLKTKS